MEAGSRSKWLGRSLVELVVIVAGVMIALAADRWIAGIDERAEACSYMSRLEADLRVDTASLAKAVRKSEERNQTVLNMLLYAETGEMRARLDPQSLVLMATPGPGETFVTETWEEMVSTGRVDLISDVELRNGLSAYYNEVERMSLLGGFLDGGNSTAASDVLWELQSPLKRLTAIRDTTGKVVFLPPEVAAEHVPTAEDADRLLRALASRKDFLTAVGHLRQLWTVNYNIHVAQLERARSLLERLAAEGR